MRFRSLTFLATGFTLTVAADHVAAQNTTRPTPDSLAGITARGRALARYDYAAWHATDALMPLHPSTEEIRGYVARETSAGWTVAFGRLSDDSSAYLVAYELRQVGPRPDSFAVVHHIPPQPDADFLGPARALEVARRRFGPATRPYNVAVLPTGQGDWWVYAVPAQTVAGVFPLGGDVRYRVSADGRRIVGERRLHNAVIEFGANPDSAKHLEAGFQTAILDNVPEDTDVFHVLARAPRVPQYVVTDAWVYRIELDGSIRLLGRRDEVLRR